MFTITNCIVGFTVLISILAWQNQDIFDKSKFNAYLIYERKEWYRFFSHVFIHANGMHLFFNMYALYLFGGGLEKVLLPYHFGTKASLYLILLYILGGILSSVPSYEKNKHYTGYNAVGASGAVSALVFASIIIFPKHPISLLFFPFPTPGWILGILYLGYSWFMSKKGNDNIGHDAHFWGAVFGLVFVSLLEPKIVSLFWEQITGRVTIFVTR